MGGSCVDDTPLPVIFGDDGPRQISSSCYQNALNPAPQRYEPIPLKDMSQSTERQHQIVSYDEEVVPVEAFSDIGSCTCQYEKPQESPSQAATMELTSGPFASNVTRHIIAPSNGNFVDTFPISDRTILKNYKVDASAKKGEDVVSDDSTYFENYYFKQNTKKFRDYQTSQWEKRYKELIQVYLNTGRSAVHHADASEKGLARWIKRQRAQYKLRQEGKPSSMTDERIQKLNLINFVWDSHNTVWEDRVLELEDFRVKHGHCNVTSSNYPTGGTLVSWVKSQRRQYRMMKEGKKSNLSPRRICQLESLGFKNF